VNTHVIAGNVFRQWKRLLEKRAETKQRVFTVVSSPDWWHTPTKEPAR